MMYYSPMALTGNGASDDPMLTYLDKSYTFDSAYTSITAAEIKPDGTKIYVASITRDKVFQFSMSPAWDIESISFDSKEFVISEGQSCRTLNFSSDGTKMYIGDSTLDGVFQYGLSVAWDVSTASYASKSLDASTEFTGLQGSYFKQDGTTLYLCGDGGAINNETHQYSLSTPWDISTASYSSKKLDGSSEIDSPCHGVTFTSDGLVLYLFNNADKRVYKYELTSAWDLATATYSGRSYPQGDNINSAQDVFFGASEETMFLLSINKIFEYRVE